MKFSDRIIDVYCDELAELIVEQAENPTDERAETIRSFFDFVENIDRQRAYVDAIGMNSRQFAVTH